jgi:alpha-D-ribose 1-methylphosphonate 5-triphosphate diphosphatase PhnM
VKGGWKRLMQPADLPFPLPARAVGLHDRGWIAHGMRADLVLVDAKVRGPAAWVAALVRGRIGLLSEAERLVG